MGGMVYGVVYESDFRSARFDFAVNRVVLRNGEKVGLFYGTSNGGGLYAESRNLNLLGSA